MSKPDKIDIAVLIAYGVALLLFLVLTWPMPLEAVQSFWRFVTP